MSEKLREELINKFRSKKIMVSMYGSTFNVVLRPVTYLKNNRVALAVREEDGSPVGSLTVNLPDFPLGEREIFVKDWSENEELAKSMLASGLFKDTGKRVPSGHVMVPIWEIL